MNASTALAAAFLLLASTSARASDTSDAVDCNNAMTQMDMNICADREYQRADKALTHAYTIAMAAEDAQGRDLLRASERAWITFRDAECKYQANASAGGSIQPMEYSNCLTELTNLRSKQLGGH